MQIGKFKILKVYSNEIRKGIECICDDGSVIAYLLIPGTKKDLLEGGGLKKWLQQLGSNQRQSG